jgi:tryptophan-rich sensory protein
MNDQALVWYHDLKKSTLTPPDTWFAPVWIALYFLMGIALFLVWQRGATQKRPFKGALLLFVLQLLGNIAWTPLFFNLHKIEWAMICLGATLFFTLLTIIAFDRISKAAAFIMLPYLFWLGFALFLNVSIWQLNGNG